MSDLHLALQTGKHMCPCSEKASRLIRCRKCHAVIARCGSCGSNMVRLRDEHERGCA